MKKIYFCLLVLTQLFVVDKVNGQCTSAPYGAWGSLTPTCNGTYQNATTCGYRGEYSTITVTAGSAYSFQSSVGTDVVTITTTANAVLAWATGTANWTATFSGQVRFYTHGAGCATGTGCRTRRVMCTGAPSAPCTNTSAFGTLAAPTVPGAQTISTCTWQSEYNTITGVVAGNSYTIGSSCGGYVTVRRDTYNGTVVGHGAAPYTFTAPTSGTYYIHYNTNSSCGTASTCCTTTITCNSCTAPTPPSNDLVCSATAISCGATLSGTTVNATNSGTGEGGSCGTAQTQPGVWYVVAGNGQTMTASLCGTAWDSKISVYSGANCSTLTCVGGNDDGGPACTGTSASYSWGSVTGTNYYILVHGFSSTSAFSINLSCVTPPPPTVANDLVCSATAISCGATLSGTTVNATNSGTGEGGSCGTAQTQPGVWYVVAGNGQTMTASLCATVWDSKISVYSGANCSTLTCVGGNDDAGPACGGTSASYSWNSVSGTNYYILVHGYSSTSAFDITLSCVNPAPADPTSISVAETSGLSNNDGTICSGASVTLTAVGGVGTVYWFTGSCATTGQINTGNSITVSPTSTTTYFARNFNGGQWSAGCASATITVNANPTVSATANPATICVGQNSQLEAVVGGVSSPGTLVVTISNAGWMDEVSWTLTNSLGATIGSGGPYGLGGSNSSTIGSSANGPYTFNLETQGTFNDNIADYVITCNGTTVLSGTLTGGLTTSQAVSACLSAPAATYAWNPSATLSNAGIMNPLASPSSNTTYTALVTVAGCQGSGQTTVTVNNPTLATAPANGDMVWRGASSNDWATTANWWQYNGTSYVAASAAPTTAQNVVIPVNQTCVLNQPNTNANNGNANSLRIENGATLTMGSGNLNVAGNWVNNGSFVPGTGTVTFAGSGTHSISGSSANHNFNNLTMNKTGEIILSVPAILSGSLTLTNGRLNIGNFNLDLPTNTINGGNANSYVKTSGTGVLMRNVGASTVNFPVGRGAYNPAALTNSGVSDKFSIRVIDNVTDNGDNADTDPTTTMAVVNRTWMIDEQTAGGSNVTLRLDWNGAGEEINGFQGINAFIAHYMTADGLWDNIGGTTPSLNVIETGGITSFSPFTISSDTEFAPLPVELMSFSSSCENEDVAIMWTTASENNSMHFEVEVSQDAMNWEVLSIVQAAQFSTSMINYAIKHEGGAREKNYYRLKQVDQNGDFKVYNVIYADCGSSAGTPSTFPNPSRGDFAIDLNGVDVKGTVQMVVLNSEGKEISSRQLDLGEGVAVLQITNMDLQPGVYYLKMIDETGRSFIIKHCFM